ncbi:MAG: long-chain-fatty-acid--CoA ligase [Hyphobacterium sp.]|nr:MAG: long-chain-fatty-acid--CoA ligase [Hyphobacterium sp.]
MDFLPDITVQRARLSPDDVALTEIGTGKKRTYAQLDERAARAASVLAELDVKTGNRVAILCRNRIAFFELLFGCAKLGAILVPLNWRMPAAELSPLIEDCDPALIIHGREDDAAAESLASAHSIASLNLDDPDDFETRMDQVDPIIGRAQWPGSDPWYLIYTSGTTGRPKGVIQTYTMAMVNYINIGQAIGLRGTDSTLNFLPLFHTAGINLHTLPVLIAGGTAHILPGFDADETLQMIAAGKIDVFLGVPAIYRELSLHPDFADTDLSRVRHWACGGAPLPDSLVECFAARGPRVCNGFGMTETGPTAFLSNPEAATTKIGSVGKSQILIESRIARSDGREAGINEVGEIQFFGPGLTPGYWNRRDETAALYTDDGWLKSGDLGRRDSDGYVFVEGRIKDMYISGGENVYPAEIENVLAGHPDIIEAAILGETDAKWGETGCAYVQLKTGITGDPDVLADFCRERLAAFKIPARFVFVEDLPRTAAGKVQKHLLQK